MHAPKEKAATWAFGQSTYDGSTPHSVWWIISAQHQKRWSWSNPKVPISKRGHFHWGDRRGASQSCGFCGSCSMKGRMAGLRAQSKEKSSSLCLLVLSKKCIIVGTLLSRSDFWLHSRPDRQNYILIKISTQFDRYVGFYTDKNFKLRFN